MWSACILALALAMDATAAATTLGLSPHRRAHELVLVPLIFGGLQSGLAALGYVLGASFGDVIAQWDHWIAAGLLLAIGGKTLWSAIRGEEDGDATDGTTSMARLWLLGFATSIDAFAAGISLPLATPLAPVWALVLIGVVTAAMSLGGWLLGRRLGAQAGRTMAIVGGLILVALAVKIVVEHST